MLKNIFKIFSLFCFAFFTYSSVFAEDLIFRQYPQNPKEGEEVKLTLESDKYNLGNAKITWIVDGSERDNGVGRRTFTLLVTNDKPAQVVVVRVEEEGLNDGSAQTIVELSSDFILYEGADSYTPPFYKGRALPAKEGRVRVVNLSFKDGVITGFKNADSANYTWKINGQDKNEYSGQNRILNTINTTVTDSSLNLQIMKLENGGTKISSSNISLKTPEVVLKRLDDKKLTKRNLKDTETGKELRVLVEPYFFSTESKESSNLKYIWKINNRENSISTPWIVLFSGKENESVKINLDLYQERKLSQEASRGFTYRVE
jgi:hypothetical protein